MLNGIELVKSRKSNVNEKMISSLEVAEMVGRRHDNVMRDLIKLEEEISLLKIEESNYISSDEYINDRGKRYPCFKLTKKGCELYATRMTGIEGTAFAIKYIERFNEMEKEIKLDSYMIGDPVKRAEKWIEEEKERLALVESLEEQKPKVLLAESIENSDSLILVGELAKILKQNGLDIGQNRLHERLRDMGYLIKSGSSRNCPTQRSMELGLFRLVEGTRTNDKGVYITKTTKVTGKGQKYFINKFLKEIK